MGLIVSGRKQDPAALLIAPGVPVIFRDVLSPLIINVGLWVVRHSNHS
nr:MAG TPA: hypothetical protein [Caudoviricetes sp.]DAL74784.1 MAG TPA: hypothetical protein [Caudoviricetes sp.]